VSERTVLERTAEGWFLVVPADDDGPEERVPLTSWDLKIQLGAREYRFKGKRQEKQS
jgi:hypothetical protein